MTWTQNPKKSEHCRRQKNGRRKAGTTRLIFRWRVKRCQLYLLENEVKFLRIEMENLLREQKLSRREADLATREMALMQIATEASAANRLPNKHTYILRDSERF
jgi:hypothetical protein